VDNGAAPCYSEINRAAASAAGGKLFHHQRETTMKGEFTAIIEPAPEGGYWAVCPEVPGANGQGETVEETKQNLIAAIELLFEDRRADATGILPSPFSRGG
jgi:predicted RNase H-like HicB family nuclease